MFTKLNFRVFILIFVALLVFVIMSFPADFPADSLNNESLNISEPEEFVLARKSMVENQLKSRDITNERVLEVMGKVPRHLFVSKKNQDLAYADHPLPIGYGQTISQPYIVALMTQSLELEGNEKVLEIGTGSGYQAAILSELVREVYTIEIVKELAERAERRLEEVGYKNVKVKNGDGYFGWEKHAPYDAIMITCAADHIPPPLLEQLNDNGRLIIPLGSIRYYQTLTLITKMGGNLETRHITTVSFVPMTGEILR